MDKYDSWVPERNRIIIKDDIGSILLEYDFEPNGNPVSKLIFFGNEKFKNVNMNFKAGEYKKEQIEDYWKKVLKLDKDKKLTLDNLLDIITKNFIFKCH